MMNIFKFSKPVACDDASKVFETIRGVSKHSFLLESKDVSHIYGRLSLIGIDPVLEIRGKNKNFSIKVLNRRGEIFLANLKDSDLKFCDNFKRSSDKIEGEIFKESKPCEENARTKRKNIAQIIRVFLSRFKQSNKEFIGLYGAFSYDFIRLFEEIPELLPDNEIDDFRLFLYDSFVFFDHLKDEAAIVTYRKTYTEASKAATVIAKFAEMKSSEKINFKITNAKFDLEKNEYKKLVEYARNLAKKGDLFEVVYSNVLRADFKGDPFALYQVYRESNPSPYLFFFDFVDEQLVGASPEMMVRCENGMVHLRPISGTALRGNDPIEDHENMLKLLQSEKERSELDMLIDLGRNDLTRICEPGIEISDYRFVEKYSKVMHTVAHLTGKLRKEFISLDALIACLNAGTLTGAPKVAAMVEIEKKEKSRRGYYGGTVGYFTLSGNMDTGIVIRTAHISKGKLTFRVGATLLYDCLPEAEYQETINKAQAFINTYANV